MKLRLPQITRFLRWCLLWLLSALLLVTANPVRAQGSERDVSAKAELDQKLNAQVPLDSVFRDETGHLVRMRDYFGEKPVILALAYYECPNLCTLVLNAMLTTVQDLKFTAGREFEIVVLSIDPREKPPLAAAKKRLYTGRYGRPEGVHGWHFLTGEESAISAVAGRVGFRYVFDPETNQFAHPSAILVLTPDGRVSRYFAGIEYPPQAVRLALVEASNRKIGSLTDQLFLLCFHYNPLTGKYGLLITRVIQFAGCSTAALLAVFMFLMFRRDKAAQRFCTGGSLRQNGEPVKTEGEPNSPAGNNRRGQGREN